MIKELLQSVAEQYKVEGEDLKVLTRLVELHHKGDSPDDDIEFDRMIDELDENSNVFLAFLEYQSTEHDMRTTA